METNLQKVLAGTTGTARSGNSEVVASPHQIFSDIKPEKVVDPLELYQYCIPCGKKMLVVDYGLHHGVCPKKHSPRFFGKSQVAKL